MNQVWQRIGTQMQKRDNKKGIMFLCYLMQHSLHIVIVILWFLCLQNRHYSLVFSWLVVPCRALKHPNNILGLKQCCGRGSSDKAIAHRSHTQRCTLIARHGYWPNGAIYWSRTGTSPDHRGSRLGNVDHWWTHWSGSLAWTACCHDTRSTERSLNHHNAGSCRSPGDRANTLGEKIGGGREKLWGRAKGE